VREAAIKTKAKTRVSSKPKPAVESNSKQNRDEDCNAPNNHFRQEPSAKEQKVPDLSSSLNDFENDVIADAPPLKLITGVSEGNERTTQVSTDEGRKCEPDEFVTAQCMATRLSRLDFVEVASPEHPLSRITGSADLETFGLKTKIMKAKQPSSSPLGQRLHAAALIQVSRMSLHCCLSCRRCWHGPRSCS
jgi:hypothetical protein